MNRRKRWLLRNAKMLAVCGAMVYLATGLTEVTSNAGGEKVSWPVIETPPIFAIPEMELEEEESEEAPHQSLVASRDWDAEEAYLLAKIAMAEAEGEDTEGKALVIMVVLNRAWSDKFPDSIEEVIMQRKQFSVTQEGGRWWTVEPNEDCCKALDMVMTEQWDKSQGALYFESKGKSTWHQNHLEYLFQHGNHYFYKEKEE